MALQPMMLALSIYTHRQLTYPLDKFPTKYRLDHPEQQELLCTAILEHGSVQKACQALGMHRPTVYRRKRTDKTFCIMFEAAKECLADMLDDECVQLADDLATKPHQEVKDRWSAVKLQIEERRRQAGKLRPTTEINFNDNRTVVVTEQKRAELQARLDRIQSQIESK